MEGSAKDIVRGATNTKGNPGLLIVGIDEVKNLKKSLLDIPDPYVIVEFAGQRAQTEVQTNSYHPVWKSKFYFKTDTAPADSNIIITVMDSNKITKDQVIGYFIQPYVRIVAEENKTVKLASAFLKNGREENARNVEAQITLSFLYQPDRVENKIVDDTAKGEDISMQKFNYNGVFKFTILSGNNLTRLDKFQHLFLEIYQNRAAKPLITDKKKQKNAQFNDTYYFLINNENKTFLINDINVDSKRFIAGYCELDLKNYPLVRHRPETFPLTLSDNHSFKGELFCEMTFFYNYFTKFPVGRLRIDVLSLPKLEESRKFYFKFAIEGSEGAEAEDTSKFTTSSITRRFKTGGMLDKISLVCFEQGLTDLMTSVVARCEFYLSELRWGKPDPADVEFTARKSLELIGKNLIMTANISLKYRSLEEAKGAGQDTPKVTSATGIAGSKAKVDTPKAGSATVIEENQKQAPTLTKKPTFYDKLQERLTEKDSPPSTFQKKPVSYGVKNEEVIKPVKGELEMDFGSSEVERISGYVLVIHSIELADFLLRVKLFESPNYYFSITSENTNNVVFSSTTKAVAPTWENEQIVLYVQNMQEDFKIKLHELGFASVAYKADQPVPIDIISANFSPNQFTESLGSSVTRGFDAKVAREFKDFIQKNHIRNDSEFQKDPIKAMANSKFNVSFVRYTSYFIDNYCGVLNLTSISGSNISLRNASGIAREVSTNLQIGLNKQIFNINDKADMKNPRWTLDLNFMTSNPMNFISLKVFDTDPEKNRVLLDAMIPLYSFHIVENKGKFTYTLDLSQYDMNLEGSFDFEFNYTALPNIPTKSLKSFEDPQSVDLIDIMKLKSKQEMTTDYKAPITADWQKLRSDENLTAEIILQSIALDFKVKEDYIITTEVKTAKQYYYAPKYVNMSHCLVDKKFMFTVNAARQEERHIIFNIKACDKANPSKILRLYSYTFDWSKYLIGTKDFVTVHANLLASSIHTQEKNPANSIQIKYRISKTHMIQSQDYGILGLKPLEIRTDAVLSGSKQIWKPVKIYILAISFNGTKQYYKGRFGEPTRYRQVYMTAPDDDTFADGLYDAQDFFIGKEKGEDNVLEFLEENKVPKYYPLVKNNRRNIKFKLYQVDPDGLGPMDKLKSNPSAKVMAKGLFDVYKIQAQYSGAYSLKLHKELVFSSDERFSNMTDFNTLGFYINFEVTEQRFKYSESVNPALKEQYPPGESIKIKNSKDLNEGVLIVKPQAMEFAANQDGKVVGHVLSVSGSKGKTKNLTTAALKNIISNPKQFFYEPNISFNPLNPLFDKTNLLSLAPNFKGQLNFETTALRLTKDNPEAMLKEVHPDLKAELVRNNQAVNLETLTIGSGIEANFVTDLWNDNFQNGSIALQLRYYDNFFTKVSKGRFVIHRFEIQQKEAKLQNLHQIQFALQAPLDPTDPKASNEMSTVTIDKLQASGEDLVYDKPIELSTFHKETSLYIRFKEKSANVLTKLKVNLFELDFINPQKIQKTKVEPSDLQQEKVFVIPLPQAKAPGAYAVLKLWFYYKDQMSAHQTNFQDIMRLLRFKNILDKRVDRLRRICYFNPDMEPLIFPGKFRRFFYGTGRTEFSFLPRIQGSRIKEVQEQMKKEIAPKPNSNVALSINIPPNTQFILPGVVSLKQPILIKLVYASKSRQQETDKNVVSSQTLKLDNCTWEQIVEDRRTCFRFKLINAINFSIPQKDVIDNKVDISFEYCTKKVGLSIEKGTLDYTDFITQTNSGESVNLNFFLRPSNHKLPIVFRRISSKVLENPVGKITFQAHRLVILNDGKKEAEEEGEEEKQEQTQQLTDEEGLHYQNKSLLLKGKALKGLKSGDHYKFFVKLGLKLEHQKRESGTFNHQGIPVDVNPFKCKFSTSSLEKEIAIELLLDTNPAKRELSSELVGELESGKNQGSDDAAKSQMTDKIVLAKAKVCLGSLPLVPGQTYPVYLPLPKVNYPHNDLINMFLGSVNRDNVYVLGSVTFKQEPWYNLGFKLGKLEQLKVVWPKLKSYSSQGSIELDSEPQSNRDTKFGVTMEISRKIDNGNIQELYKYESMIYQVWPTDNNIINFRDDENCNFIYEDTNPNDELIIDLSLCYYKGQNQLVIAKKNLSIKKYFYNIIKSKQSQKIQVSLVKEPGLMVDFIDSNAKEFPISLEFKASNDYKNMFAPQKQVKTVQLPENQTFDFRETSLEDMVLALINAPYRRVIVEAMKEINEFLLYTSNVQSINPSQVTLLYNVFRYVYQLYPEMNIMSQLGTRNLLALFNFDPAFLHKINIMELLDDFAELIVSKMAKGGYTSTDQELSQTASNFKYKFAKTQSGGGGFDDVAPITKENLSKLQPEQIYKHMKNNSLSKPTESLEDKDQEKNNLVKMLSYISKILETISAQGEQFVPLVSEKCLTVLTQSIAQFIKTEEVLLLPYLQILRKLLIEYENIPINDKQLKAIFNCLEKVSVPNNEEQAELFLRVYSNVQQRLVTATKNPEEQKALYKRTFEYLTTNYKESQIYYHYQLFEIFLSLFEQNKTNISYVQDTLNQIGFYPKFLTYLNQVMKIMEQKLADLEIKQITILVEEIILKFDIKNVNFEKIGGVLQVIENQGGINAILKLKIEHLRGKLRRGKDSSPTDRKQLLKERLQNTAKDKNQDIKSKYLISKLDWMG